MTSDLESVYKAPEILDPLAHEPFLATRIGDFKAYIVRSEGVSLVRHDLLDLVPAQADDQLFAVVEFEPEIVEGDTVFVTPQLAAKCLKQFHMGSPK